MLAYIKALLAAMAMAVQMLFRIRVAPAAAGLALLVAGCLQTPPAPLARKDPSDPAARVPRVGYHGTLGSYASQRPVEPAPWRERNEQVAPAQKP